MARRTKKADVPAAYRFGADYDKARRNREPQSAPREDWRFRVRPLYETRPAERAPRSALHMFDHPRSTDREL